MYVFTGIIFFKYAINARANETSCSFRFTHLNLHLVKGKQLRLPKNFLYGVYLFIERPADLYTRVTRYAN